MLQLVHILVLVDMYVFNMFSGICFIMFSGTPNTRRNEITRK